MQIILLVGVSVCVWLAFRSHSRQKGLNRSSLAASVIADAGVLEALRAGRVADAIEAIELGMGCDLLLLCTAVDTVRNLKRDPQAAEALRAVRDYHAQYPLRTELPDLDKEIARILAKIS